jgi:Winged helix-turn helix
MSDAWGTKEPGHTPHLESSERATLEHWVRAPTTPQRIVTRSRIVLLLDEGLSSRAVARRMGISRTTVDRWRARYIELGCDVLKSDRPGRGRKRETIVQANEH